MKSIWIRGRSVHLGEPWEDIFGPPPPKELFKGFDVRHPSSPDSGISDLTL